MAEPDDFYAYTETLNAKRRAAKKPQESDFSEAQRPEVVNLKKNDDFVTVDPARIRGGEVSR